MPHWQIFHPKGVFGNEAERTALAKDITSIYTGVGLPAFYVIIHFVEQDAERSYIGEEPQYLRSKNPFIRFVVTQIAIRLPNEDAAYQQNCALFDAALKPHIADKGYDWEYHVIETERRLWKINGMTPPLWQSEEEKIWIRENRAVEYPGAYPSPLTV